MNKRVYLSPSNQGENHYITGDMNEKRYCEELAGMLREELERCEIQVFGWKPTLAERIAESNRIGVDVHLAIHTNASTAKVGQLGTAQGVTVFTRTEEVESTQMSRAIYRQLWDCYPRKGRCRGVLAGSFAEILRPRAAAPYLEIAFHDNPEDAAWLLDSKREIAQAVCRGLCDALGVSSRPSILLPGADWQKRALVAEKKLVEIDKLIKEVAE